MNGYWDLHMKWSIYMGQKISEANIAAIIVNTLKALCFWSIWKIHTARLCTRTTAYTAWIRSAYVVCAPSEIPSQTSMRKSVGAHSNSFAGANNATNKTAINAPKLKIDTVGYTCKEWKESFTSTVNQWVCRCERSPSVLVQRTLGDPVVPDLQSSAVTVLRKMEKWIQHDTTRYNTIQHDNYNRNISGSFRYMGGISGLNVLLWAPSYANCSFACERSSYETSVQNGIVVYRKSVGNAKGRIGYSMIQ